MRGAFFVGQRELSLEHIEARRERELRAAERAAPRFSCDSSCAFRRPDFAGESNIASARTVNAPPALAARPDGTALCEQCQGYQLAESRNDNAIGGTHRTMFSSADLLVPGIE